MKKCKDKKGTKVDKKQKGGLKKNADKNFPMDTFYLSRNTVSSCWYKSVHD